MKLVHLIGLTAVLLTGAFFVASADDDERDLKKTENEYVKVTKLTSVYEKLDPRSEIVGHVKPGDFLELLSEGQLWYKVRVEVMGDDSVRVNRTGYMRASDGNAVPKKGNSSVLIIVVIVVLALGFAGGVVYFVKKSGSA